MKGRADIEETGIRGKMDAREEGDCVKGGGGQQEEVTGDG